MRQTAFALAAAAMLTALLPSSADARCHNCGGAVAAGVIGGVVAGAIVGSAIAGSQPGPVYVAPPPTRSEIYYDEAPVCHVEHRRIWLEGYGWRHRRVEVCE